MVNEVKELEKLMVGIEFGFKKGGIFTLGNGLGSNSGNWVYNDEDKTIKLNGEMLTLKALQLQKQKKILWCFAVSNPMEHQP